MDNWMCSAKEDLCRYIGQTVTIFTTSGGYSGSGFTGVLISVSDCIVRLLINAGDAPSCPLGSSCSGYRYNYNQSYGCSGNPLGAIAIIPTNSIAAFTHNAI
ncbi:hypothetical protein [uncultured Tyzzerella sp.]|uniref:hypothetical protein n=1 Tax=uncultured Tyzzerella sp. TaxID=2321398 RepID=UPI0029423DBB|nr:hypothetical protein [uncultured Tyzzerella sp.]